MRIIIAEDEKRARRALRNIITSISSEYEVVGEAANGADALELIKILKPDVVMTDIRMPQMTGLELAGEVKRLQLEDIKFVIISAYEEFDYAKEAISLGVSEYLVKPLIMEDIVNVLHKLGNKEVQETGKMYSLAEKYKNVHPLVMKALKRIEADYALSINQKELAGELGISQEYFSNIFSKNIGVNFSRFVRNYRIDVAKALLLHDEVDKNEVPFQVGFTDEKYFNRVFKEVTGLSVSSFLKENGKY